MSVVFFGRRGQGLPQQMLSAGSVRTYCHCPLGNRETRAGQPAQVLPPAGNSGGMALALCAGAQLLVHESGLCTLLPNSTFSVVSCW